MRDGDNYRAEALSFGDLISPVSANEFFDTYWEKDLCCASGPRERYQDLFTWDVLNRALEEHRLTAPRLRLYRRGMAIDPSSYQLKQLGRNRTKQFVAQLEAGATLILDSAEELYAPLRAATLELERVFRVPTNVNLYASWKSDSGFNIHFDRQENIVFQVYGRKHWRVWRPTRAFALRPDIEEAPPPCGEPVFDGLLNEGDFLYIPRGWWHVAVPVNSACLHLTATINTYTGVDLLQWIALQSRRVMAVRQTLPLLQSGAAQESYLTELRSVVEAYLKGSVIDDFLADMDRNRTVLPAFSLPALSTQEMAAPCAVTIDS